VTRAPRSALLLPLLLALLPGFAAGQVEIEALSRDDPPLGLSGSLGGDVTARTGNVDFIALDVRARMYRVSDTRTRLLQGNGGIGFLDRDRFASSGLLHYRVGYTRVSRYFLPEWYAQVNYDRPQKLAFRAVTGGGGRIQFARGAWGQFGAGTGLMLEREWLRLPDGAVHPERTLNLRWNSFLTLRVVASETTVITSTTYLQPAIGDVIDTRALETFRLATSITESLSLAVSWDLRWDSDPPDGLAALDTTLRTGVTYTY
jgi:hypothetical protein